MRETADLVAHGLDHARVAMADVQHGDPGEEVEVLVAVDVPQTDARPAHELDGVADVRGYRVLALEAFELDQAHSAGPIFVP